MKRPADAVSAINTIAPTKVSNRTPKRRFIVQLLLYPARKENTKAPPYTGLVGVPAMSGRDHSRLLARRELTTRGWTQKAKIAFCVDRCWQFCVDRSACANAQAYCYGHRKL